LKRVNWTCMLSRNYHQTKTRIPDRVHTEWTEVSDLTQRGYVAGNSKSAKEGATWNLALTNLLTGLGFMECMRKVFSFQLFLLCKTRCQCSGCNINFCVYINVSAYGLQPKKKKKKRNLALISSPALTISQLLIFFNRTRRMQLPLTRRRTPSSSAPCSDSYVSACRLPG
jgi:hypothetical protein